MKLLIATTTLLLACFAQATDSSSMSSSAQKEIRSTAYLPSFDPRGHIESGSIRATAQTSVSTDSHRRLAQCSGFNPDNCIECTMSDGTTPGKKCDGSDACTGTDTNNVACGSCNGVMSCVQTTGTIGENSCNSDAACLGQPCKFCLLSNLSSFQEYMQPVFLTNIQ